MLKQTYCRAICKVAELTHCCCHKMPTWQIVDVDVIKLKLSLNPLGCPFLVITILLGTVCWGLFFAVFLSCPYVSVFLTVVLTAVYICLVIAV
jgi:hypothetical protein